jgi:DNA-binding transcriptional ArsR family regulator
VHAFDVLGEPVRRRILELLTDGELTSGAVTATIRAEFDISQPAVSQHLKVLRDNGFANVRAEGTRRLYAIDPTGISEVDRWLDRFRASLPAMTPPHGFWHQRLDALATELARGRRAARGPDAATTGQPATRQPAQRQPAQRQPVQRQRATRAPAAKAVGNNKETA